MRVVLAQLVNNEEVQKESKWITSNNRKPSEMRVFFYWTKLKITGERYDNWATKNWSNCFYNGLDDLLRNYNQLPTPTKNLVKKDIKTLTKLTLRYIETSQQL